MLNQFRRSAKQFATSAYLRGLEISQSEEGLETIEWVALGAVIAVFIGAIIGLAGGMGGQIGQTIFDGILKWASKIGGGQ